MNRKLERATDELDAIMAYLDNALDELRPAAGACVIARLTYDIPRAQSYQERVEHLIVGALDLIKSLEAEKDELLEHTAVKV